MAQMHLARQDAGGARAALDRAISAAREQHTRNELDAGALVVLYRARSRLVAAKPIEDVPAALVDLQAVIDLGGIGGGVKGRAHRDRGHLFLASGQPARALRAYQSALRLMPGDLPSLRWRAETLLRLKRGDQAVAAFSRYLERGGRPLPAYKGRGTARALLGEHDGAVGDFTLALALAPGDAELLLQRGRSYLGLKAWAAADRDFDEVLKKDAGSAAAYLGRGQARVQLGLPRRGVADAEQTVKCGRSDPHLLRGAAGVLAQAASKLDRGRAPAAVRQERDRLRARAVDLLRTALEQVPASQRRAFWARHVRQDHALQPLRGLDGYRQLERRFEAAS
jgi:tetratricopeptide (TPR) repeat protein